MKIAGIANCSYVLLRIVWATVVPLVSSVREGSGGRTMSACRRFEGELPNAVRALSPSIGRRNMTCGRLRVDALRTGVCERFGAGCGRKKSRFASLALDEERGFATEGLAMSLSCLDEEALLIMTCDGRNGCSCHGRGAKENWEVRAVARVGEVVEGTGRRRVVEVLLSKTDGWDRRLWRPKKEPARGRCELLLVRSDWPGSQRAKWGERKSKLRTGGNREYLNA